MENHAERDMIGRDGVLEIHENVHVWFIPKIDITVQKKVFSTFFKWYME